MTGLQYRLLGLLVDGTPKHRADLEQQHMEELELGHPDFGDETVPEALDELVESRLVRPLAEEFLLISRAGVLEQRKGVNPAREDAVSGSAGPVPGVLTPADDPDADDRLVGGAEGLSGGGLDVLGARD